MNLQIKALNLAYAALANTDTERGTAQFELEAEAMQAILEAREQLDNKYSSAVQPVNQKKEADLEEMLFLARTMNMALANALSILEKTEKKMEATK